MATNWKRDLPQWEQNVKRAARRLKDEHPDMKLCHAYEQLARDNGFQTYASMRVALESGNFTFTHRGGVTT
jgi:hypothetical protein